MLPSLQISFALAGADKIDKKDLMKKLPKFIYDEEKALEVSRFAEQFVMPARTLLTFSTASLLYIHRIELIRHEQKQLLSCIHVFSPV